MKNFCVLYILLTAGFCAVFGQGGPSAGRVPHDRNVTVTIPKFDVPPVIDGRLNDEIWKKAAVFDDFTQIQPGDNIAPSKATIAYAGYDEKYFYIGFHAFEDPNLLRATIPKRDDIFADDNVRVTFDTFNDERRAYVFFFNPFGVQADAITDGSQGQGGGSDFSIDVVMESKGVLLDDGYSVEVRIPFKSLRYAAGKGHVWGFNVGRRIPRLNDENDSWMPIARDVSSLRQIGKINGLTDIKNERSLEIVPSITLSESGERIADARQPFGSRLLNHPIKRDIGVSLKYHLTPNVTLDAAVNPDFAEVEADAPVVRANERFPIFFAEKRPFFLEGIDYFRTSMQVVNTRNIADPDVAVKLTGKTGRNTFGLLSAVDRFPGTNTKAYIGVMRLKRDFGEQSNIGLIATTYHFGSQQHNNLAGADGKFQLDPQTVFAFQVIGTNSSRAFYDPNINNSVYRAGNGLAYDVSYDYTGKNRGYRIGVNGRTKDYRADVGFTRRTDTHNVSGGFRIGTEPNSKRTLIGLTTRTFLGFNVDGRGRLQNTNISTNTEWNFQHQLRLTSFTGFSIEKIYEDEFGARRNSVQQGAFYGKEFRDAKQFYTHAGVEKTFSKGVSFNAGVGLKVNALDLDFGASSRYMRVSPAAQLGSDKLDPGKSFDVNYDAGLSLQPADPWRIDLRYSRDKLRRYDTGRIAFDSNIYSVRSTYQFSRFTFMRTRVDYETVYGTINSQILLGWSPNPGTAFYAGYNDNSNYRGFNDFRNRFDDGLRRDGRGFFIRVSYLFRKNI